MVAVPNLSPRPDGPLPHETIVYVEELLRELAILALNARQPRLAEAIEEARLLAARAAAPQVALSGRETNPPDSDEA